MLALHRDLDVVIGVDTHNDTHTRGGAQRDGRCAGAPDRSRRCGWLQPADGLECPYCRQAEPVVRALLANFGDLRYDLRHMPLIDVAPRYVRAASLVPARHIRGGDHLAALMGREHHDVSLKNPALEEAAGCGDLKKSLFPAIREP